MSNLIKLDIVQAERLYNIGFTVYRGRNTGAAYLKRSQMKKTWLTLRQEGFIINQPKCSPFYVNIDEIGDVARKLAEYEYKGAD